MLKNRRIMYFCQISVLISLLGGCSVKTPHLEHEQIVTVPDLTPEEIPVEEQTQDIIEEPIDNPIEKPIEKPVEIPLEKPIEKKDEKPEVNRFIVGNPNDVLVLVNRERFLPRDYKPDLASFPSGYAINDKQKLKPEVVEAFVSMVDALKEETGLGMFATSTYRTYEYQENLFNRYVSNRGYDEAVRISALPGSSEHQTGLTLDVETIAGNMFNFGLTEQSKWVDHNAHRFGFIVRYEAQFESITGYKAEPWHLRFIGDHSSAVYESKRPFEEYYFSIGLK